MLKNKFDCIVVGAGHAGLEATFALANLDYKVLLITSNIDRIGHLSCNPAIGGLAKGHIVREIDALGGMMAKWADLSGIQFRILNQSKGPAVRATRAQIDREVYMSVVKADVFAHPNITVWQDIVDEILSCEAHKQAVGVKTAMGLEYFAKQILLTTGTFLQGLMHIGLNQSSGGRLGDAAANKLSASLNAHNIQLGRLKTGTPPRLLKSSIDFSKMEEQAGEDAHFSFFPVQNRLAQISCYITATNEETHNVIRSGLDRSPLYTGVIEGVGARYCPSIEDKISRFADRARHHVFIEPEGLNSQECYANGISTSLPIDIQQKFVNTIAGLENAHILRPGYAIEYDFANPMQLHKSLETKAVNNLWFAGQINGTSGYEEAAGQGLWAALNMAQKMRAESPFILGRDESYIAVLVDDLVTMGTEEPYRMFTSRAEYRLLLRENNADARLTKYGYELGLISSERYDAFSQKQAELLRLTELIQNKKISAQEDSQKLQEIGIEELSRTQSLAELLKRPNLSIQDLVIFEPSLSQSSLELLTELETIIKYDGYLKRQGELVSRAKDQENRLIDPKIIYKDVAGLSREIVEKLERVRPLSLGQALRISGVTPAALDCIEIHLRKIQKLTKSS